MMLTNKQAALPQMENENYYYDIICKNNEFSETTYSFVAQAFIHSSTNYNLITQPNDKKNSKQIIIHKSVYVNTTIQIIMLWLSIWYDTKYIVLASIPYIIVLHATAKNIIHIQYTTHASYMKN